MAMLQRHQKWGERETQTRINVFRPSPSMTNIKSKNNNNCGSSNPRFKLFLFYGLLIIFWQDRLLFPTPSTETGTPFTYLPSKNTSVNKPLDESTRPFWKPKWQFSLPFCVHHIVNSQTICLSLKRYPIRVDPSGSAHYRVYPQAIVWLFNLGMQYKVLYKTH